MSDHVLLYDADCGLCTWIVAVLLRWDGRGRLRPLALQDPEAARHLPGMDAERRMNSVHLAGPGGEVASAGAALPALLALLPGGGPPAAALRRAPRLTERGYRLVADHRSALSRGVPARVKARARRTVEAAAAGAGAGRRPGT